MKYPVHSKALAALFAVARIPLVAALLVTVSPALELSPPFGSVEGDLGQLAPKSLALKWEVNDPPGAMEGHDNGFFRWTQFDVDPGTRQIRGQIQLSIMTERWTKQIPMYRKTNFSWKEERQKAGTGYQLKISASAGNMDFLLSMTVDGNLLGKEPDPKALLEEMIALIPRMALADSGIEVTPRATPTPAAVGLVPASGLFPARIVALRNPPGRPVYFSLPDTTPALLEAAGKPPAKAVDVQADPAGKAEVLLRYVPADEAPLPAQLTVGVVVANDTEYRRADVKIGLGLAFDRVRAVPGAKYAYAKDAPFPLLLSVKSTFQPGLRVAAYLAEAQRAKVWGDAVPALLLETRWADRPADSAVEHEPFRGSVDIVASRADGEDNFLSANIRPWYSANKFFYPAVILKAPGNFLFEVAGRAVVLDAKTKRKLADLPNDPLAVSTGLVLLSSEQPESALQSLACSFEAQTKVQALMLETAKKMPLGYGTALDSLLTGTALVCGLMKEEYEKSFLELANFLGGKYLDHLETPEVFATLTPKQQEALGLAKRSYERLNQAKQEGDVEKLK